MLAKLGVTKNLKVFPSLIGRTVREIESEFGTPTARTKTSLDYVGSDEMSGEPFGKTKFDLNKDKVVKATWTYFFD